MINDRVRYSSGAAWEPIVGYCRAIRVGDTIHVAGTTALGPDGAVVGKGDPAAQTRRILDIISDALVRLRSSTQHVVRTRVYVTDISRWEEVGRVHGEFFASHPPASTMVEVSALVHPDMLVEIEADAVVPPVPRQD